jgi:hypothetical protein
LILLLLTGCPGGSSHPVDPKTGSGSAASAGIPVGPPVVFAGEKFSFDLALQGVQLATYDFEVGDTGEYDGKQTVQVHSHAKAVGLVKMVANVDDLFTSWIDVATGRPVHWAADEFAVGALDRERSDVFFSKRDGDTIPVEFHLNDDKPTPEPQKTTFPEVWDFNSLMIGFRAWEAPEGSSITGEVFRSRYMWHYKITMGKQEKLVTKLGDFPALRIEGHVYKVDRTAKQDTGSDERNFSIWISADQGKVPLKILGHTDYGDIEMNITSYDPGAAGR